MSRSTRGPSSSAIGGDSVLVFLNGIFAEYQNKNTEEKSCDKNLEALEKAIIDKINQAASKGRTIFGNTPTEIVKINSKYYAQLIILELFNDELQDTELATFITHYKNQIKQQFSIENEEKTISSKLAETNKLFIEHRALQPFQEAINNKYYNELNLNNSKKSLVEQATTLATIQKNLEDELLAINGDTPLASEKKALLSKVNGRIATEKTRIWETAEQQLTRLKTNLGSLQTLDQLRKLDNEKIAALNKKTQKAQQEADQLTRLRTFNASTNRRFLSPELSITQYNSKELLELKNLLQAQQINLNTISQERALTQQLKQLREGISSKKNSALITIAAAENKISQEKYAAELDNESQQLQKLSLAIETLYPKNSSDQEAAVITEENDEKEESNNLPLKDDLALANEELVDALSFINNAISEKNKALQKKQKLALLTTIENYSLVDYIAQKKDAINNNPYEITTLEDLDFESETELNFTLSDSELDDLREDPELKMAFKKAQEKQEKARQSIKTAIQEHNLPLALKNMIQTKIKKFEDMIKNKTFTAVTEIKLAENEIRSDDYNHLLDGEITALVRLAVDLQDGGQYASFKNDPDILKNLNNARDEGEQAEKAIAEALKNKNKELLLNKIKAIKEIIKNKIPEIISKINSDTDYTDNYSVPVHVDNTLNDIFDEPKKALKEISATAAQQPSDDEITAALTAAHQEITTAKKAVRKAIEDYNSRAQQAAFKKQLLEQINEIQQRIDPKKQKILGEIKEAAANISADNYKNIFNEEEKPLNDLLTAVKEKKNEHAQFGSYEDLNERLNTVSQELATAKTEVENALKEYKISQAAQEKEALKQALLTRIREQDQEISTKKTVALDEIKSHEIEINPNTYKDLLNPEKLALEEISKSIKESGGHEQFKDDQELQDAVANALKNAEEAEKLIEKERLLHNIKSTRKIITDETNEALRKIADYQTEIQPDEYKHFLKTEFSVLETIKENLSEADNPLKDDATLKKDLEEAIKQCTDAQKLINGTLANRDNFLKTDKLTLFLSPYGETPNEPRTALLNSGQLTLEQIASLTPTSSVAHSLPPPTLNAAFAQKTLTTVWISERKAEKNTPYSSADKRFEGITLFLKYCDKKPDPNATIVLAGRWDILTLEQTIQCCHATGRPFKFGENFKVVMGKNDGGDEIGFKKQGAQWISSVRKAGSDWVATRRNVFKQAEQVIWEKAKQDEEKMVEAIKANTPIVADQQSLAFFKKSYWDLMDNSQYKGLYKDQLVKLRDTGLLHKINDESFKPILDHSVAYGTETQRSGYHPS
jgi:hypothetical protein